jgi:hypothetical protein
MKYIPEAISYVLVFLIIVLCAGDPDLLDEIIAWVRRQP